MSNEQIRKLMSEGKIQQFVAGENFWQEELGSGYVKGLVYTLDPDNKKLAGFVEQWLVEQKILMLEPGREHSIVRAVGTVT